MRLLNYIDHSSYLLNLFPEIFCFVFGNLLDTEQRASQTSVISQRLPFVIVTRKVEQAAETRLCPRQQRICDCEGVAVGSLCMGCSPR